MHVQPFAACKSKTRFLWADSNDYARHICDPASFRLIAAKPPWSSVGLLERLSKQKSATSAQIALGGLLAQRPWIVLIRGTTKLHGPEDKVEGSDGELTLQELLELKRARGNHTTGHALSGGYPSNDVSTTFQLPKLC